MKKLVFVLALVLVTATASLIAYSCSELYEELDECENGAGCDSGDYAAILEDMFDCGCIGGD